MAWNGFFDLGSIKDLNVLKQFYYDALELSTSHKIDILKSFRRETLTDITAEEYIEKHISLKSHNVCIDRTIYYNFDVIKGEIGSSTLNSPSYFLFIYLELNELYKLVEKYQLTKKEF